VAKTVDETALLDGALAGDVLTYTITAVNTGNVTLGSVTISDPMAGAATPVRSGASAADSSFDAGDTWVWQIDYTLTQSDIDAGSIENYASVTGTPEGGSSLTAYSAAKAAASNAAVAPAKGSGVVTTLAPVPAVTGVKASVLTDSDTSGDLSAEDQLTYTITVENTGNVSLTGVKLSSEVLKRADGTTVAEFDASDFTVPADVDLAPGETAEFSATYTVQQADIDAGGLSNSATVAGSPPTGSDVSDVTDSGNTGDGANANDPTTNLIEPAPEVSITKTVDDQQLADGVRVGDVLTYTIVIKNTGNVTLTEITLADVFSTSDGEKVDLTEWPDLTGVQADTNLDVGESWTYTASFTLDADAIKAGGVENIATVTAKAPNGDTVSAQSTVKGNTTAEGKATGTEFPGEISGGVREYLAAASGVTVYLLVETAPNSGQYVNAEDENGDPITTTTDSDGHYSFLHLTPGRYGISFGATGANSLPTAISEDYQASGNEIVDIVVDAGAVELHQDAFFVDPSGVIYDSETLAPIAGAKVTLYFNGAPVPDSWLNVVLAHENGALTGPDGSYAYLFDPATAQSGVYTIVVEKAGYKPSVVYPANALAVQPALGGGLEKIVADDVPGQATPRLYHTSLRVQFAPGNPAQTSNGIVNNHIPMDLELLPLIEDEVVSILKDDLAMTISQQGQVMGGFAEGALGRLKSRDTGRCAEVVEKQMQKDMIRFADALAEITPDSADLLDDIAQSLLECPTVRFEVGGHTADTSEGTVALSMQRAQAVVTALVARGIDEDRLIAQGYGGTRPLAAPATTEGQARNERISFMALKDLPQEDCLNSSTSDHAFNATANDKGASMNGGFNREDRRCSDDSWRIVDGNASYASSGTGIDQMLFDISIRREKFTSGNTIKGHFVGAYGSSSAVTGLAEGSILGFGLNAGLYGAHRIGRSVYLDYYLGAAGGHHAFELDFVRLGGGVTATGAYSYGAVFAGAALSGEADALGLALVPRAGVNLAWSPGGSGTLNAVRGALADAGDLTIPAVMGARIFAEVTFDNLLAEGDSDLSFTPRVLCDKAIGDDRGGCGYGASVEISHQARKTGRTYALGLEAERVGDTSLGSLSLRYAWPLGVGAVDGGVDVSTSGEASVQSTFKVEF
jgi:uncharacterized repeat protein (TIGR01451 family)